MRSAAPSIDLMKPRRLSKSSCNSRRLLSTYATGLLISWAMPADNWPNAASRSVCSICCKRSKEMTRPAPVSVAAAGASGSGCKPASDGSSSGSAASDDAVSDRGADRKTHAVAAIATTTQATVLVGANHKAAARIKAGKTSKRLTTTATPLTYSVTSKLSSFSGKRRAAL